MIDLTDSRDGERLYNRLCRRLPGEAPEIERIVDGNVVYTDSHGRGVIPLRELGYKLSEISG